MSCKYESRCVVFERYREYCPRDSRICEIARFEEQDLTKKLDEEITAGDMYLAQLQSEINRLREKYNLCYHKD
ncbi:MAG: hypothetical protein ACTSPV_01260 [Candidatus Hodarchaeales archaeon]